MSDAFEVFGPFEPLGAAEEPAPEPRPARRWSAPAARPTPPPTDTTAPRNTPARPEAPTRRLPTGADLEDALDAVLFGPRGPEGDGATGNGPESDGATGSGPEGSDPASPALVPGSDLAAFRAIALSELEAAAERLAARGHLASLADDLDHEDPVVTVLFRPDQGPLAAFGSTAREPARFELRLAADLDGESQVVAGYDQGGSPNAPFTLLSRTRLATVRADWVAKRFVEFVQRVLRMG